MPDLHAFFFEPDGTPKWAVFSAGLIGVMAFVYIGLERLFPYDKGQKVFRKGWFNDFVMYTLVQSYVMGLVIAAIIAFIDTRTNLRSYGLVSHWPLWQQALFFFVLHDFYIYWFHRAQHRFPLLWRTHEAHHSVENVDWLAGSRSHPIEILINQTIEFAPIALLGAAPEIAIFKGTIDAVWGMYIHSNINVKSGPLQYVINGPEMHRWHHSREYINDGMNFGTKLAIWDYIFGTAYRPDKKPPGYGLDEPFPTNYFKQILFAFRSFKPATSVDSRPVDGAAQAK
jgi:sterol desaturase/sphingolipid hydroxylase (fatty acid hydroxylase superfamily)